MSWPADSEATAISIIKTFDGEGNPCVGLVLSPNAMFETSDGDPYPGIGMTSDDAREVAIRLLKVAQEIDELKQDPIG